VKPSELARAWGLSRARTSQYKKAGMPLSSFAEAEAWRLAHYGVAGKNGASEGIGKNLPTEIKRGALPEPPALVKEADLSREDFHGTLARLVKNEMVAWSLLATAVDGKVENEILIRERHYQKAARMRIDMEKKVDEILIERGEQVTLEQAKELFGRFLMSLRLTLKTLPTRLAARCNPSDPDLPRQVLNEAIDRIFKSMNEWEC